MIKETIKSNYQARADGQYRDICPACSHTRKQHNQTEKVLAVKVEWPTARWLCHHCGEKGGVKLEEERDNIVKFIPPVKKDLAPAAQTYLEGRGLSADTINNAGILSDTKYIRDEGEVMCAGFPYIEAASNKTYAVKWRALDSKGFTQEGAAATFFGIEKIKAGEPLVIVEGEIDQLSLSEIGVAAVSVPNGAPIKVSDIDDRVDPTEDRKFGYVWAASEMLKATDKVVIAVDRDGPGNALAEELARRIGKPRCWSVTWPEGCKDANDVLLKEGKAALANCIEAAEPWPIAGLYDVEHYADQVRTLYQQGEGRGLSTGYECVDQLFTIKPMVYVITGVPSMGKSEFLDQILFNLSQKYDWRHAVCSFENPVPMHVAKLLEKTLGKPFHDGPTQRMSEEEMERGLTWVNDHFLFMEQSDGTSATIDAVLERGSAAVQRMGVRSLTIDPYNYLDMNIGSKSETNLISEMLTKVRNWSAAHDCAVFFVAHPAKLYRQADGSYPVPKGYDISSSAAWFSKADVGLSVHRPNDSDMVEVHCWKVRFKHIGNQGVCELSYNKPTGTYAEAQTNWEEIQGDL